MHTSFTTLVESRDRYTLVMQTPVLGFFAISIFIVYSPPFNCAYNTQFSRGQGICKGICAQQHADTCGYICAKVAYATATHRNYITTVLGAFNRV